MYEFQSCSLTAISVLKRFFHIMDKLEDIAEFFDSLKEHEEHRLKHRVLWEHVQKAEEELDTMRENNDSLNKNLTNNIGVDFNITTEYVNLKERHDTVLKEIENLKNKLETLKVTTASENEKAALESEVKIKTEEELGKKRIDELKRKIVDRKMEHELKVEKLQNELELARAAADLEQDEIETTLLRELMDLNKKIWRQQNGNRDLQIEIDDLKRRQQAITTPMENHDTSLNPDDLEFFHLNNIDDLFNNSKNYDNKGPQGLEPKSHAIGQEDRDGELETTDHYYASKYQPLQIIRKREPFSNKNDENKDIAKVDTTLSSPCNKDVTNDPPNKSKEAHFEFGIAPNPTSEDNHIMMTTSFGQRGKGDKLRSILKQPNSIGFPANDANRKSAYSAHKKATPKVTFATDKVTSSRGRERGKSRPNIDNMRYYESVTSETYGTQKGKKIVRNRTNIEKENNKALEGNKTNENGNTTKINRPKKRKLFNLDDLGYLDNIKMNSDDSD